jgi:hypothetical protein
MVGTSQGSNALCWAQKLRDLDMLMSLGIMISKCPPFWDYDPWEIWDIGIGVVAFLECVSDAVFSSWI